MQKFTGRGQLVNRLASQVGSLSMAIKLLQQRGHMDAYGNLTEEGRKRNEMTASERAIDRASKELDRPTSEFLYNPITNRATLKQKSYGKEKND